MRKALALALLGLLALGCGELFPTIPKASHTPTAPQPQPASSTPAAQPAVRSEPLPQPAPRPLVDHSRIDAPEEEVAAQPEAVAAFAHVPEPKPETESESDTDSAKQRLERVARNWRDRHGPKIDLLKAGNEPREPLRFAVAKGHAETLTMTLGMGVAMKVGGQSMAVPELPKLRLKMRIYVTDVRRGGDIAYEAVVHAAEVLPLTQTKRERASQRQARQALETAAESLVGLSGTGVVSPQGLTRSVRFHVPATVAPEVKDFLDQIKQSAAQFSAPFPEEAVGVGAEWRVRTFLNSRGVRLTQIATYRLLRRDQRGASLLVKVTQLADKQRLSLPEMPPGAVVQLTELSGRGTGRVVIAPDRLGPVTSQLDVSTDFSIEVRQSGRVETLSMSIALDLAASTGELADGMRLTGGEDGGPKKPRNSRIVR